jgi:hypothetical protein
MESFYNRRNRLHYPTGVLAGFDPTHPAAQGITARHGCSFVASAGSFKDVLYPQRPTVTAGTISTGFDGIMGQP